MEKTQALLAGLDAVLAAALGSSCAACGDVLEHPTRGPVCEFCWRSIAAMPAPTFAIGDIVDLAQAVGPYEGALRSIIQALKYEGRRSLAEALASHIRARCALVLDGADFAVPVPLHGSRRRERGFNQALDLARGLGLPVARVVRRVRATTSQTDLPAEERRRNVRHAFAPARCLRLLPRIDDRVVVVVDDVTTTGTTIEECARVLKAMGAREVRAVTAARVVMSPR